MQHIIVQYQNSARLNSETITITTATREREHSILSNATSISAISK